MKKSIMDNYVYEVHQTIKDLACDYKDRTDMNNIPKELLHQLKIPCIYFGKPKVDEGALITGMKMGEDGHCLVIGGSGSGKSSGIVKPTLLTWKGSICCTDIKGELSSFYIKQYENGKVDRPYQVFDPTDPTGPSYDPFYILINSSQDELISSIWKIVYAIVPDNPDAKEPFWTKSTQTILYADLMYYYNLGFSFVQTITLILGHSVAELCKTISNDIDSEAKSAILAVKDLKPENIAFFDMEIRNALTVFSQPYMQNALRGERDGASYFTWDILNNANVFLKIPESCIEQWSGVINLLYTQLIQHLEKRPEKYLSEGADNTQTLIIMDEFARFGKLKPIKEAVSTLRSKSVNLCIVIQSLAQLDNIYGESERRIILDNCQYKVILGANDPQTQEMISKLIGTEFFIKRSYSENSDTYESNESYVPERRPLVYPHELSTMKDAIILSPYGKCRIDKIRIYSKDDNPFYISDTPKSDVQDPSFEQSYPPVIYRVLSPEEINPDDEFIQGEVIYVKPSNANQTLENTAESVPEGTDFLHPNKAMCKPYTFNALNEAAKEYSAERRRLHGDDCSSVDEEKPYSTVGKMFCNNFSLTSTQNYEPSEKYYEFLNMFIESIASDPDIQDVFKAYMENVNV